MAHSAIGSQRLACELRECLNADTFALICTSPSALVGGYHAQAPARLFLEALRPHLGASNLVLGDSHACVAELEAFANLWVLHQQICILVLHAEHNVVIWDGVWLQQPVSHCSSGVDGETVGQHSPAQELSCTHFPGQEERDGGIGRQKKPMCHAA